MTADAYPPLGECAFLSDCRTAALIGPDGAVEWLCAPRFDSPSVFARLLDRRVGGAWDLTVGPGGPPERRYAGDTLVLESRWTAPAGTAVAHDFLAARPAADDDPRGILPGGALVRLVRCERGRVTVRHRVDARPDHARRGARWTRDGDALVEGGAGLRISADLRGDGASDAEGPLLREEDGVLVAEATLREGGTLAVALAHGRDGPGVPDVRDAPALLAETLDAWRTWLSSGRHRPYEGYGAERVRRSLLVLRGLMYSDGGAGGMNGALVAAPTTSLPEWPGGGRNWDYRYVWHRDAALVVLVLLRLGHHAEAGACLRALLRHSTAAHGVLTPMLDLDGSTDSVERTLDHLDGHLGSRPVRHGNSAHEQRQLDVHGQLLDAALVHRQVTGGTGDGLGRHELDVLFSVVDAVCDEWPEPDHGIWEVRNRPRHWTSSKLYAWVCVDRGIRLADLGDDPPPQYETWQEVREQIRASLLTEGYDTAAGAFTQSYGSDNLDASLLRLSLLGFLPGDDARVVSTVDRIDAELGEGGWLVHRYDVGATDDGVGGPEGGFLLCSFDMVSALVLAGRREEARRRFEALCARAGRFGLFSEEMTVDGTVLGNFPQAFTHLALIEAAMNLDAAGDEEELHAWARRTGAGRRRHG